MATSKAKRFFGSHIFRIVVYCLTLFSTVFFPMLFAYPAVAEESKGIIVVIVVFAAVLEVLAFALLTHYLVYAKIKNGAKRLRDIAETETYNDKISIDSIDVTASEVLDAVNVTCDGYMRLEQARKSFVSNASHELRTPLTSVQGFLQAVLDGTVSDDEREKYLKIALGETKRLNSLITSMLDLSRLDSGKNPLVRSKFDIADAVREIVTRFEPVLVKKALQINVEFEKEPCYVFADKEKIIQVISNLVDNAVKYSPSYSRIIVTTNLRDNKVYVTVRDYGYGIGKKDQMLIWDRFYMTDKSHSPVKTKGSGLGLSIVKKIIDEHGEVIWVESSRGAGATFIFTLPQFDATKHGVDKGNIVKDKGGSV